jgi:hypothetical protein
MKFMRRTANAHSKISKPIMILYQKVKSTQLQRKFKITEINEYDIFGERHGQPAKLNYEISTM